MRLSKKSEKNTIVVSFTYLYQEVSLVRTGILDYLIEKGYRLLIVVQEDIEKIHLEEHFAGKNIIVCVHKIQDVSNFFERVVDHLLVAKYWKKRPPHRGLSPETPAAEGKIESMLKMVHGCIARLIPEKILLGLMYHVFSKKDIDELYDKYRPILTVLSWAGYHTPDGAVVRSAKKYGCRTISVDGAWDQMEDGPWLPKLDKLLVWNEQMKSEAIEFHAYPPDKVEAVGILRCDFYRKRDLLVNKDIFLERYGLDKKMKIVTLVQNNVYPVEAWRKMISALRDAQNLQYPVQIFVRLAPFMEREDFKDFLGDPLVRIEEGFSRERMVSNDDISSMVNLLAHSDIIVSLLSTIILESCYFDRPNISVAFEPVRHLYKRAFIQPLLLQQGIKIACDETDLMNAVNAYLVNPRLDGEGRERIRKKICFGADGKAAERTIVEIEKLLPPASFSKNI